MFLVIYGVYLNIKSYPTGKSYLTVIFYFNDLTNLKVIFFFLIEILQGDCK